MEPLIVWTDALLLERGASWDFALDLAYGTGDSTNDFTLDLPSDVRIEAGGVVHVDGTGWGGMVDRCSVDTDRGDTISWQGRTWQGMLEHKVLRPHAGQDYLYASGTVAECVAALIEEASLPMFSVGECPTATVSYRYWRYVDAWHGLLMMLASAGMRPTFSVDRTGGRVSVLVGAVERTSQSESVTSDLVEFSATRAWRGTNHIVLLGKGELSSRLVRDLYVDESGNVGTAQSLFGDAEICETYELTSVETEEELIAEGTKRIKERMARNTVELTVSEGIELDVGDVVDVYDARVDLSATAQVGQVVVRIEDGLVYVKRETGSQDTTEEAK